MMTLLIELKKYLFPNSSLPPKWATGCFYGGETQILLDENNPYERFNTLAHESFSFAIFLNLSMKKIILIELYGLMNHLLVILMVQLIN
ncbi:MAG: hypothetical protein L6V91_01885 [Bacilli bacterium]|nr:MAG: hypothetical protein L6V91_01885 [Bacilli bacterium]